MSDILNKIVAVKHQEIEAALKRKSLAAMRADAESRVLTRDFEAALRTKIAGGKAVFTRKDGTPFAATPADGHLPAHRRHGLPAGLIRSPAWQDEADPVHPILGAGPGPYRYQLLSDPGGITQFGAFIEELPPGSRSGHRHWHEAEDEMVVMLSGEVVLVEDVETTLRAGDVAAWPAGHPVGHRLDNRSDAPARYLVIGTRGQRDRIHYSDHDLITEKDGATRRYLHRDGTPYGGTP